MTLSEQEVVATYRTMRSEINQLVEKIAELEQDVAEHTRVEETLKPLEPTRKAYRMIGGVLAERTVQQVLPAVQSNKEGIVTLLKNLQSRLEETNKKAAAWQAKYNIKTQ